MRIQRGMGAAAAPRESGQTARSTKAASGGTGFIKSPRTLRRNAAAGAVSGHKALNSRAMFLPAQKPLGDHATVTVSAGGGIVIKVEGATEGLSGVLQQALDTVLGSVLRAGSGDTMLRDSARDALLDSEERYTPSQLDSMISIGRRTIDRKRRDRNLVAVRVANRFEYPVFQVDTSHRRIYPIVEELNPLLPEGDEWDVLSWWTQPNASLPPGTRPADLVPGGKNEHESLRRLVLAAGAHD